MGREFLLAAPCPGAAKVTVFTIPGEVAEWLKALPC